MARLLQMFGTTILAAKLDAMHPEDKGYTIPELGARTAATHTLVPGQAINPMVKNCDFVVGSSRTPR